MDGFLCLRCKTVPLHELPSPEGIRFLECPQPDRSLTFRWLHPITVALYGVIFDRNPVPPVLRDFLRELATRLKTASA